MMNLQKCQHNTGWCVQVNNGDEGKRVAGDVGFHRDEVRVRWISAEECCSLRSNSSSVSSPVLVSIRTASTSLSITKL